MKSRDATRRIYRELLEQVSYREPWRPAPGKVTRSMAAGAAGTARRRSGRPPAPGKVTLSSQLPARADQPVSAQRGETQSGHRHARPSQPGLAKATEDLAARPIDDLFAYVMSKGEFNERERGWLTRAFGFDPDRPRSDAAARDTSGSPVEPRPAAPEPAFDRPVDDAPVNVRGPEAAVDGLVEAEVERLVARLGLSDLAVRFDRRGGQIARAHGSRGVAIGSTVALDPSQFDPHTREGVELLAHEAVHVAQGRRPGPSSPARAEAEASFLAREYAQTGVLSAPRQAIATSFVARDENRSEREHQEAFLAHPIPLDVHATLAGLVFQPVDPDATWEPGVHIGHQLLAAVLHRLVDGAYSLDLLRQALTMFPHVLRFLGTATRHAGGCWTRSQTLPVSARPRIGSAPTSGSAMSSRAPRYRRCRPG